MHANPTLQSFLSGGKSGDYIVAKVGKLYTLIHLRSMDANSLVIEEISGSEGQKSWADWVKNRAPGHSSWSILEIDLINGQIRDCFSFSKSSHLQISKNESIIATLLQLPLTRISDSNRRKIGPPPLDGEPDFRKIWNPKLIFNGKDHTSSHCDAYEAVWPNDGTDLEGHQVILYFDASHKVPFPCWIDIQTTHITGRFHVIDSGENLVSPAFKRTRCKP